MATLKKLTFMVLVVLLALFILGLKGTWIWRSHRRRYARIQSNRALLSDEVFCEKAGVDSSLACLISIIRSKLAVLGRYDPLRIYPDDKFHPHFGLDYDDDVAMVVQNMKIIEGYQDYSFPLEEVATVGDFVKVVLRIKREHEEARDSRP